jgi:HD superfamily phosphodiesterase
MPDLTKLIQLADSAYQSSEQFFAQWMYQNHVPLVAKYAQELCERFSGDKNIAVAGAWLHDFGDVFVHRHDEKHDQISQDESLKLLKQAEYSQQEINQVMEEVIAHHSCRDGDLPVTIEGKILATADSLAHLTTDFYLQFAWMHLPDNMNYQEYKNWVKEKIDRDFHHKIFFAEIQDELKDRFEALEAVFGN